MLVTINLSNISVVIPMLPLPVRPVPLSIVCPPVPIVLTVMLTFVVEGTVAILAPPVGRTLLLLLPPPALFPLVAAVAVVLVSVGTL